MKHLKALVMMQLKDKLDFSFVRSKQKLIAKIVFTVLKFLIVAAIAYGFFLVSSILNIFSINGGVPDRILVIIYGIIFVLSLLSCTIGLMKNLYFAEDNKFLTTLPVNGNMIFLSRLIIYYIFELKRSFFLTIPIFIGFGIIAKLNAGFYFWLIFVFIFMSAVPVLLGAILSIPAMYIYRFLRRVPGVFVCLYALFIGAIVFCVVKLIGIIPERISLVEQIGNIQQAMHRMMRWGETYLYPVNIIVYIICGFFGPQISLDLKLPVIVWFLVILGASAIVGIMVFLLARPLFFKMMSKSFEFEKKFEIKHKPNKKRGRIRTFFVSEIRDFMRSDLLSSFLGVYITVPILIFFINKIFCAIDTRTTGQYMVYSFNLLLIMLPMLASNALVATMYSRGGRAAYVTKTMPLSPVLPLTIKIIPLMILSFLSLCASVITFGYLARLSAGVIILFIIACTFLQWGHMFWSAIADLMNPQNEQYATTGGMDDNPNEQKSTIKAFVLSAVFALFSFILFSDQYSHATVIAGVKLMLIGLGFLIWNIYLYVNKIKVYYNEK